MDHEPKYLPDSVTGRYKAVARHGYSLYGSVHLITFMKIEEYGLKSQGDAKSGPIKYTLTSISYCNVKSETKLVCLTDFTCASYKLTGKWG